MSAKPIPRGWIEIGDAKFRLDQVVAVLAADWPHSVIALASGCELTVLTKQIPPDFLDCVAKSQRRSEA